ncbi:MAG: TRAP transporter substrate-binding protein [Dysosmobacter sp.]
MKRMFALLLSLTMVFSLTACGGGNEESSSSGSEASGETITIKLPHCYSEGHPLTDTLENFFKPELESRSGGRLTVDLYPNSTLATEEQIYEGLRNNTYEMGVVGTIFQDRIPSVATFQLPFLFSDFDQAREALYEQDYGQQLIGDVASLGFTVNGIVPDGFRVMTLNRKAESLADLKGLKLRMPNLEVMVKIGECLGCAVTPMAMTEVFSALEQNVIDGQENPPSTIRTQGWYEIQDYLLVSNHVFTSLFLCVNSAFYDSLDPELQGILDEVIDETSSKIWDSAKEQAQADLDFMDAEADIEVYYPSDTFKQEMIDATASMYDDMYATCPEVEEIVTAIRAIE